MSREDTAITLPWMHQGTELVCATVDGLSDAELRDPSALPEWSRAHVIGHLARNAEALTRLAMWAETGVETPMYRSLEARDEDIELSAQGEPMKLRVELIATAAALDAALARLDAAAWQAAVRSVLGRILPARGVPWMRVREVWLHALDLDAGLRLADFPSDLVDAFLDDITAVVGAKMDCPPVILRATDRDRAWTLHPADDALEIAGPAAELLAWISGRPTSGLIGNLPKLPAWL